MTLPKIPNHSAGGTFIYSKEGELVEHKPPTKPGFLDAPKPEIPAEAAAIDDPVPGGPAEPEADANDSKPSKKRGQ